METCAVRQPSVRWSFRLAVVLLIGLVAGGTFALWPHLRGWLAPKPTLRETLVTIPVRRSDLHVKLTSAGRIDSAERTLIECELERLEFGIKGQAVGGGGASTILTVIDEGTEVKKGEILCELDASDYEEMLRLQMMTVEARSGRSPTVGT